MKKTISTIILIAAIAMNVSAQNAAVAIVPGTPRNAVLPGGGSQRYSLTVPGNRLLSVYTVSNIDTLLTIYNAAGNEIAHDDDSGDDYNARIYIEVPAGTYTIEVKGFGNNSGPYTLHVLAETTAEVAARVAAERASAPIIVPGRGLRATLPEGQTQSYRLTVASNGTFITAYTESDIDTMIRIVDAVGREIAYDDDSGDDLNARIYIDLPAGTYYIEVSGYSDNSGPYTLHVTAETAADVAARAAAERAAAPIIVPGREVRTTLREGQTQMYRVTVPAGDRYISAYTESNIDTMIRIIDADGREIASDDDSGDDFNAWILVNVAAGTYYIEVSGYYNASGPYTLHVSTGR